MRKRKATNVIITAERIEQAIHVVRGQRVMLDSDLAELYGVTTSRLNEQVSRNRERFPEDFAFQLTQQEFTALISQTVTSKKHGGLRKLPYVFTEQGVAMLSSVLRSPQSIKVNIEIMRAFIHLRQTLSATKELGKGLLELKSFTLKHSQTNDREFKKVWLAIEKLTNPSIQDKPHKIGFDLS